MVYKDIIYQMRKEFSAYSALFNLTPHSTFMRDGISNKVIVLFPEDEDGKNLEINNELRLKTNLYDIIRDMYNNRIKKYNLSLKELPYVPYDDMVNIFKLKLKSDNDNSSSGKFVTYPKTFFCDVCGDFVYLGKDEEFENFNPKKCRKPNCKGKYTQFHFVGFCEDCGNIMPCSQGCKEHRLEDMELIRRDKDDLRTWELRCRICGSTRGFVPTCFHKDYNGNSYLTKVKPKRDTFPLNMNDGSIFKSVVRTIVDIPEGFNKENNGIEPNSDYILFGIYLQKFDHLYKKVTFKKVMEDLNKYIEYEDNEDELEDDDVDKFNKGCKINEIYELLGDKYSISDISEINDYLILTNFFNKNKKKNKNSFIPSYNEFFNSKVEINDKIDLNSFESKEDYESFKTEYNISNIIYIPDIHLISASIGKIRGINRFYEEDFVPHFEPHWLNKADNKIKIYAYPFQTEGLMIDLDKVKIVNWLIDNNKLVIDGETITNKINSYDEAKEILFKLEDSSYDEVKKLLHTFSHVLMSRSSLYTGLDVNSCSEIIFPKSGAFVIYSTSNVNIGGFKFVFENSLDDWFNEVKLDVYECIFDPTCIQEKGACFSCLHLPEYVCSEFNEALDRDVFIGENRYDVGFWKDI